MNQAAIIWILSIYKVYQFTTQQKKFFKYESCKVMNDRELLGPIKRTTVTDSIQAIHRAVNSIFTKRMKLCTKGGNFIYILHSQIRQI